MRFVISISICCLLAKVLAQEKNVDSAVLKEHKINDGQRGLRWEMKYYKKKPYYDEYADNYYKEPDGDEPEEDDESEDDESEDDEFEDDDEPEDEDEEEPGYVYGRED